MPTASRREMVRAYKETKPRVGVFALRCTATGEAWVGVSANLDQQPNAVRFTLRLGTHPNPAVQAACRAHGPEAFLFEALEAIDDEDIGDYSRKVLLAERQAHWIAALGARKLF